MSTTVKTRSSVSRLTLLASSIALLLAGCGNDMDELQARVDEIKNAPGTGVEPLPEVKPYETFAYAAVDQRSPFEPGISALSNAPNANTPGMPSRTTHQS